jgi:hypothetical protein
MANICYCPTPLDTTYVYQILFKDDGRDSFILANSVLDFRSCSVGFMLARKEKDLHN